MRRTGRAPRSRHAEGGMRLTSLLCALALVAVAPVAICAYAQDAKVDGAKPTLVAAKKAVTKKKTVAKPTGPPAKQLFGAVKSPAPMAGTRHRLLRQGLPCRRHRAAHRRSRLAGHAPVAQPQLGASRPRRPGGEAGRRGPRARRLAGAAGRRPFPTARRADGEQPCQPSGRSRRRHLVHADARPAPDRAGARRPVRRLHGDGRCGVGRSQAVDRRARSRAEARGLLCERGAHFRAPRHQEGGVR